MKTFSTVLLLTALVAVCSAGHSGKDFSKTDEQGGYHFGFNDGHQARQEQRTPEGVVRGAYRYIDANGETQTITYTADKHNGFVASGASIPKVPESGEQRVFVPEIALPVQVEDTPEVKLARAEHLEAHKKALLGESHSSLSQFPYSVQFAPAFAPVRSLQGYNLNQELLPRSGYLTYASQPAVRYVIQGSQYHPDYLPYAAL